jgi:Flp pilus assembly protein TadD
MRFLRVSAILFVSVLMVCNSNFAQSAAQRSISGRLMVDNATFSCEFQCQVTLLASGVRPVQTAFVDFGGRFAFNNIPAGLYTVRVEIEGFETVNQEVEAGGGVSEVNILIPLVRKNASTSKNSNVVDVSEFLGRYPKKAVSYFEKGNQSLKKRKTDEAMRYFQNAVELAPNFYEAHNQLAITYREAGRLDDAEREFFTAHELNAAAVEPLLNLTDMYLKRNETERAVTTGEQAVQANSHSAPAFLSLGVALYKADELDRAETALKRAFFLDPKMASVRLMLANVYLKLHRYDSTLEQLDRYIAENPKGQQIQDAMRMRDELVQANAAQRP